MTDEDEMRAGDRAPRRPSIPDLRLVRRIGQGAYGEVWIAENRVTHRTVAVKIIALSGSQRAQGAARELASLIRYETGIRSDDPNLLKIHHVGQTEAFLYYTMDVADHVDGSSGSAAGGYQPATLASRMDRGRLPTSEVWHLSQALLSGLARIHASGLAHRDVKPSNCLFVRGTLQLADFGLLTPTDITVSRVGTPQYMPPDGKMDARADVYAAGLVIYEMLTGLPAAAFPRLPVNLPNETHNRKFQALNRLVLRACSRDPSERFDDAGQMLTALRAVRAEDPHGRPHRRAFMLTAALALLAGSLVTIVLMRQTAARPVEVNFITEPFEAEIYLDGHQLRDANGQPYRTPCTVFDLPPRPHRVTFRKEGLPDLVVGKVDFAETREVAANWKLRDP